MNKIVFQYLVVVLILINIAHTSIFSTAWILIYLTSLLLLIHLVRRKRFDPKIIYVIGVWIIINIIARMIMGGEFDMIRVFREAFTFFLLPYLVLQQLGINFWQKFEKVIYVLTFISLPLFILNVVFIDYFNDLVNTFRPVTSKVFHEANTYWSSIIYVNAISYGALSRNCGFMWEPGAFALIIVWAIAYNWLTKGIIINRKLVVYTIALITTFSTAGYFALFFLFLANFIKRLTFQNITSIIIIISIFFFYIYNLDFMSGKVDKYMVAIDKGEASYSEGYNAIKLNRFQIALYDIKRVYKYPFGYGSLDRTGLEGKDVVGTNGLSGLLRMWGAPAFIYMIILLSRYLFLLNFSQLSKLSIYFLLAGLLIMFFSNPLSRNIFIYLILITPLIYNVRKTVNIDKF